MYPCIYVYTRSVHLCDFYNNVIFAGGHVEISFGVEWKKKKKKNGNDLRGTNTFLYRVKGRISPTKPIGFSRKPTLIVTYEYDVHARARLYVCT